MMISGKFREPDSKREKRLSVTQHAGLNGLGGAVGQNLRRQVDRQSVSHSTAAGWKNAPARFFPELRSTAVLPPTENHGG